MERLTKFIQVGTSNNVILSRVQIKSCEDDDWLTFDRYKVIERRLSDQLGTKLKEINSQKPNALEDVHGQIVMDDVKVTYSLRNRQPPVTCIVAPQAGKQKLWKNAKEKHVDESVCKYRNYGSLFGKNNVIRAELAVVIERLPLSDIQRRENVPDSKANRDAQSVYFTGELDVRPSTPREKKVLKLLFKGKGHRKRKLSSSDSENVSASPPKERSKHEALSSQPAPAKDKGREKKRTKSCKEGSIKEYLEKSKEKQAGSPSQREKEGSDTSAETEARSRSSKQSKLVKHRSTDDAASTKHERGKSGSREREPSKHKAAKDTKESVRAPSQPSPHDRSRSVENAARASSAAKDRDEKILTKHKKVTDSPEVEEAAAKSSPPVKNGEHGRKEEGRTERQPPKDGRTEKALHKNSRTERQSQKDDGTSHRGRNDEKPAEKKHTKAGQDVPRKKEKATHSKADRSKQENLPRKSEKQSRKKHKSEKKAPETETRLKKLLMDCGLSDSDSDDENVLKKKKMRRPDRERLSPSKTGPSSPLRALQEDPEKIKRPKRESLEDFDFKLRKGHGKEAETRSKTKESSAALCKSLLFGSDEENDSKKTKEIEEYDPTMAYVSKVATVPRSVSYSPSPVKKSEDVPEGGRDEAYVPTTLQKTKKAEEDLSSLLLPVESTHQRNFTSHTLEEYVPTALSPVATSSPARSVRGRYEEYVPQAITSTARRQLHTIDYVPTPKKDASRKAYASAAASRGDTTVPELEEEIKSARDVKDLEDKHIKYLFYKCIPDMEGIIKKKVRSWRNDDYHHGGKAKRMLTYKVYFSAFSDEQIDLISELFIDEYVIRKNVSGDYLNQVLLPEFLIRVFMATNGTSHEESDRLMAATPFKLFDVPTHL